MTPTVFIFDGPFAVEDAVVTLGRNGVDVTQLSLIGRGSALEDRPLGFYARGRHIEACGGIGAFWGSIWSMLYAPAVLHLPGIGLVAMAGPIVSKLADVIEGSAQIPDQAPLVATLAQMGMPREQIDNLELAVRAGKYLLIVDGASRDLVQARAALQALRVPSVA